MATGAVLAKRFLVLVILLVTGIALFREFDLKVEPTNVAARTLGAVVFAA